MAAARAVRLGRAALALFSVLAGLVPAVAQSSTSPTPVDCNRSVRYCNTCRYQFFRGTTTKAICTKCDTGYVPKASGRACYCAPGYYTNESTSVTGNIGFGCKPCGAGYFCPGSKVTAASSKVRVRCGNNKLTTTDYAQSDLECMVQPGYGWGSADSSSICDIGSYNPGYNARKCTPCPGGLTTLGQGSLSSQECLAGVGFYYLRGKAVACARGTYKNYTGNQDCDKCPTGTSTPNGTVSADVQEKCNVLLPGYEFRAAGPVPGVTEATECPPNTYRSDEQTFRAGGNAIACTPCPNGLVTLPNVTRATSLDACVTPPGHGWSSAANSPAGQANICGAGWYNPGYNRQPCVLCGTGLLTDAPGATAADSCYTPAGWGNTKNATSGAYAATACPVGTYGRPANTYGLVDVECTKCPDHSTTKSDGATGQDWCLVEPGYGWDDGAVNQCNFGYWNEGGNQRPCSYCGDFYNTTNAAWSYAGEMGSDSRADCKVDFGYSQGVCPAFAASQGITACLRGYFKDTVGPAYCQLCPNGTSTSMARAATARSDCNTCRPGFGVTGGKIDPASPACAPCGSGTFSSGYASGGQACKACPQAANFSGRMVSRAAIFTSEDCYGEFTSDGDNPQNYLAWDYIPMASPALALVQGLDTPLSCQNACSTGASCQYFVFYATGAPDGGSNRCYHRNAGALTSTTTAVVGSWDAPKVNIVLFEIKEGHYVVYPKLAGESIGVALPMPAAVQSSFLAARAACDASRECVGLSYDTAAGWSLFGASLREDVVGKYRVVGDAIDPWLSNATGNEQTAEHDAACSANSTGGGATNGVSGFDAGSMGDVNTGTGNTGSGGSNTTSSNSNGSTNIGSDSNSTMSTTSTGGSGGSGTNTTLSTPVAGNSTAVPTTDSTTVTTTVPAGPCFARGPEFWSANGDETARWVRVAPIRLWGVDFSADAITTTDQNAQCAAVSSAGGATFDPLRAMCINTEKALGLCPIAALARHCVAAKLNLAVSKSCNGEKCLAAYGWAVDVVNKCCASDEQVPAGSVEGCLALVTKWNEPMDFESPDTANQCDAPLPTGKAAATARPCKVYQDEWYAAAAEGNTDSCEAGFCGNSFLSTPAPSTTFARGPEFWAGHGSEAAFWIASLGGSIKLWGVTMTADSITQGSNAQTCRPEGPDALRALCISDSFSAKLCPQAALARQCVAARLNLAVSSKCAGGGGVDGVKQLEGSLGACCDPENRLASSSVADCTKKMAWYNQPKDFADPDIAATCDRLPVGKDADTVGPCNRYIEEWAATVSSASDGTACEAGFCSKDFILGRRRLAAQGRPL